MVGLFRLSFPVFGRAGRKGKIPRGLGDWVIRHFCFLFYATQKIKNFGPTPNPTSPTPQLPNSRSMESTSTVVVLMESRRCLRGVVASVTAPGNGLLLINAVYNRVVAVRPQKFEFTVVPTLLVPPASPVPPTATHPDGPRVVVRCICRRQFYDMVNALGVYGMLASGVRRSPPFDEVVSV